MPATIVFDRFHNLLFVNVERLFRAMFLSMERLSPGINNILLYNHGRLKLKTSPAPAMQAGTG